ncbi:MAG: aryl-alcohol dehydrogenase-like predicted oxidoreductase [Candidatus Azotimanducaceae bacterium]|jgi:aryl-alcohol dehydrogenase-like predicted oxidoreductase
MRYKVLGKSGVRVSELALGAMTFGTESGIGADKDESRKVYNAFRDAGGNFIDTANVYNRGTSETFLGEFMAGDRERIVLATKFTGGMREKDINAASNSRKNMMESVNASLKRLKTDYIDLYWVHAWDSVTPTEELLRGLDDLVSQGKVLYIGVSDTPAWVVAKSNTMAELRNWSEFIALQIQYSLVERTVERELLPMARAYDMAVTPWGIVGSGVLSGKYNKNAAAEGRGASRSQIINDRSLKIAEEVMRIAEEINATPTQVAIAWVLNGPANIIPLVGARTLEQWEENLGCLDVELDESMMSRLNEISAINPGFPHSMLMGGMGNAKNVDNHRKFTSGGYL